MTIDETAKLLTIDAAELALELEASGDVVPFTATIYNGGALELNNWDRPVVVDLAGVKPRKNLVAHLDHDRQKRVGQFEATNTGRAITAQGRTSASTAARTQVVQSARDGYTWEASVEMRPDHSKLEPIRAGQKVTVNGQEFTGPLYVSRATELRGFSFVSHGADSQTVVNIAAEASNPRGDQMPAATDLDPKFVEWASKMLPGTDITAMAPESLEALEQSWKGQDNTSTPPAPISAQSFNDELDAMAVEQARQADIRQIALDAVSKRPHLTDTIKDIAAQAVQEGWTPDKMRLGMFEINIPRDNTEQANGEISVTGKVLEAAVCRAGGLPDIEAHYDERTLQMAEDRFKRGIGLKQLFCTVSEHNGHKPQSFDITAEVFDACFRPRRDIDAAGVSPYQISTILSNVGNKFLMRGWNAVDQACLRISARRNVTSFHKITTASMHGDLTFRPLGADGQIESGNVGETTYMNQVDTQALLFSVTRKDMVNDNLNALTDVPFKLGRGGMLRLNDLFWAKFLDNAAFFSAANNNVSTDDGRLSDVGLEQAENIFMDQTDPDGNPLGVSPAILLVPNGLRATASRLMTSELVVTGEQVTRPDGNIWQGRFRSESSPYMNNANFTGNSNIAWYLLADPDQLPVIEIAALGGRLEPTIETAQADFDTLGVRMRGWNDIGVELQEFRGGVRADGSSPT